MIGGFTWTDGRVRDALGVAPEGEATEVAFSGISTDTRTLGPGDLFVALVGDRFDGHGFLNDAATRGARGAVISSASDASDARLRIYAVENTLDALGELARYRRRSLPARVVGITGSSGKTTVKDLLSAALAGSLRVHATHGNLNNRIGVPLTLLAAPEDADVVVLEMGTNEPGEIGTLTAVAEPDASLVTTVSEAHLTGLGSLEGVLHEKLDLLRGTKEGGPVLVGDEPAALAATARALRSDVRVAGLSERADTDLRGELLAPDESARFEVRIREMVVRAGIPGRHGAENLILALGMAHLLGADDAEAAEGAAGVQAAPLRNEVREMGSLTFLLDCYNANPQSVRAALDLLQELPAPGGRVAVLGSMLELGMRSALLHREVLAAARRRPLDIVVAIGEFARPARESADHPGRGPLVLTADDPDEAYRVLLPHLGGSETILLKGSRGLALEKLLTAFERDFGGGTGQGSGEGA